MNAVDKTLPARGTRGRWAARLGATVHSALLAGLIALAPTAQAAGSLVPWTGGSTPALVVKDLDGNVVPPGALRGRTVIVNFWATWCAPCVEEMPGLQSLHETLEDEGVVVLAVNVQESVARVRPFLERFGFTFPVARDPDGTASRAWGARALPTTFVLSPDGRIALFTVGEVEWTSAAVLSQVRDVARRGSGARIRTAANVAR